MELEEWNPIDRGKGEALLCATWARIYMNIINHELVNEWPGKKNVYTS